MMVRFSVMFCAVLWFVVSISATAQSRVLNKKKKPNYEEVDLENIIRRYFSKDPGINSIEGIYSVSCVITRQSHSILLNREQTKVVERKDNYARVAIFKDWPGSKRDFIEVSLSSKQPNHFPIVGELNYLSEGRGLIYKHIEPNTTTMSFSMTSDAGDVMEAEYAIIKGKQTITYRMSYLKIYPGANNLTVEKQKR